MAFLDDVQQARRILILGDGDGRFLKELLKRLILRNEPWELTMIDQSAGMVRLATKRISRLQLPAGRVCIQIGDARDCLLSGPYDMVVMHFFLDCFSEFELRRLVSRLKRASAQEAQWVISEFALPKRRFWRTAAGWLIGAMYCFFGFTANLSAASLPDYESVLREAGLSRERAEYTAGGLLSSQIWRIVSRSKAGL